MKPNRTNAAPTADAAAAVRLINVGVQHPLVLAFCRERGFKVRAVASDYAFAQFLGISSQAISNWRNSGRGMSFPRVLDICERLEMTQAETAYWLAEFEIERAQTEEQVERVKRWRERLTKYLTAVIVPFLLWLPTDAKAGTAPVEPSAYTAGAVNIMLNARRLWRRLRRRLDRCRCDLAHGAALAPC